MNKLIFILILLFVPTLLFSCELEPQYFTMLKGKPITFEFIEDTVTVEYDYSFITVPYSFVQSRCFLKIDGFGSWAVTDIGLIQSISSPIFLEIDEVRDAQN